MRDLVADDGDRSIILIINDFLMSQKRTSRWISRALGAVALILIAFVVRSIAVGGVSLPFLFFVPPVMIAGILFGQYSSAFALLLANLFAIYLFIGPTHPVMLHDTKLLYAMAYFNIITGFMGYVCAAFRRTHIRRDDVTRALGRAHAELRNLNATLEHRVEEEVETRLKAEAALLQSQKMEAVGHLTGGLAHDFNNLLTGIIGSLDLLQSRISKNKFENADRYIETAQASASRAAALTHRLLAFSRRQPLVSKATDVNALIDGLTDMLQRTLGLSIKLRVKSGNGLWSTLIDPGQLENALLNLCINARDAMPNGGEITIATNNRPLDRAMAGERDLNPGDYICISVTDTGSGIDPAILSQIFEPFFTTKPAGSGTGLGLSMIYGFARQSGGQVSASSELGVGTTMMLLLPRFDGPVDEIAVPVVRLSNRGHSGTVLVVEDEPSIRTFIVEVIEDLDCVVLEAADAKSAIPILESGKLIDLMVTDLGLPGMDGRQLADVARQSRPALPILFITGYAEGTILAKNPLADRMYVLAKPFAMDDFMNRIRDLLR